MTQAKVLPLVCGGLIASAASYFVYRWYAKSSRKQGFASWMSSFPLFIVLDIGSSSIRASVYACVSNEWIMLKGSRIQDTQDVLMQDGTADINKIVKTIDHLVEEVLKYLRINNLALQVVGIGFSSFVMNLFGVDTDGMPVTPIYTYADRHPSLGAFATKLQKSLNERGMSKTLQDRTGTPIHTAYLPAQILRLKAEEPRVLNSVVKWQTIASHVIARFSDQKHLPISYSEASWTGILNFRDLSWDERYLRILEIPKETLPEVVASSQFVRGMKGKYAQKWPELKDCRMFFGVADGFAANIGSKCGDKTRIAATIGTSAAMRIVLPIEDVETTSIPTGLWCYRITQDAVLLGGALSDGGSMYEWLLNATAQTQASIRRCEEMAPDSHGLTILPFLTGERSPGWHRNATCSIQGIHRWTTPAHLLRAGLESVALRMAAIYSLMSNFASSRSNVIVSGTALTSSAVWRQILANCLGKRVFMEQEAFEATSRGVAMVASPAFPDLFPSSSTRPELEKVIYSNPNPTAHATYLEARRRQEELYHRLLSAHMN